MVIIGDADTFDARMSDYLAMKQFLRHALPP
jgi:hypothetical protein